MITRIQSELSDRWRKYRVVKHGVGAASYFTVNNGAQQAAENDQSQDILLDNLPTFSIIETGLVKTLVPDAAATTNIVDLVLSAAGTLVDLNNYDWKAAASNTNLYSAAGTNITIAAQAISVRVTVTVQTMRDITDGATFDLWLKISRLEGD